MHAELVGEISHPLRATRSERDERPVLGQRDRVVDLGDRPGRHRDQRARGSQHSVDELFLGRQIHAHMQVLHTARKSAPTVRAMADV